MRTFHSRSAIGDVLAQQDARAVVQEIAPEILESSLARSETPFPVGPLLGLLLQAGDMRADELLHRLAQVEDRTPRPIEAPRVLPRDDYEGPGTARGIASVILPEKAAANRPVELVLSGPDHGNPFVDVEVQVRFSLAGQDVEVGGFYDGDGRYVVRWLPRAAGTWDFTVSSNARSLDGVGGEITVAESNDRGPVRAEGFSFTYADGTSFTPLGTTAYAWTHQDEELQAATLRSLAESPFTKLRMGLFPKSFLYNANEPERFVFPADESGSDWDTTRFDLEYFRQLERRIAELGELGIEADLILFHPYDRWGFARLGRAADDRYVSYVVRRLAAFPNVWWSLANEYDLLLDKEADDWDRMARVVQANDHVGHPLSIHNWIDIWDYSSDWATHCSIQTGTDLAANVRQWRQRWEKPVIVDECGYEGDLDQGWGFLTAEEEVRRFWEITLAGGYATHGETFYSDDHIIFWAKGGQLRGESPARLAFLRSIVEESPTGEIEPLTSDFDASIGGVRGTYQLIYFGAGRPAFRDVVVPSGMRAEIDVIDTWNMTVATLPGAFEGTVRVGLPARPYMAIRLRSVRGD